MTDYAELCERLKKLARSPVGQVQSVYGPHSINSGWNEFRRDMTDSAAEIERLSAENEALQAKLKIWVPTTRTETETTLKGADQ